MITRPKTDNIPVTPSASTPKLLTQSHSPPVNLQKLQSCVLFVNYPFPSNCVMFTPLELIEQYDKLKEGKKRKVFVVVEN